MPNRGKKKVYVINFPISAPCGGRDFPLFMLFDIGAIDNDNTDYHN